MTNNYAAVFEIEHGVSKGFGVSRNETSQQSTLINAENDLNALKYAYHLANEFAKNYLATTEGYKTVKLQHFKNENGKEIDQRGILRLISQESEDIDLLFPEGKLTIKRTWIEDMIETSAKS